MLGKPEGKRPFERPRLRWNNNIKMDIQEVSSGGMEWIELAHGRDSCCECGNESPGSKKCEKFLD